MDEEIKMSSRRPTIIDVARLAGVSKSTAGRVLAGASNVTEEARRLVFSAAKSIGYERNDLAVGMRSGRTGLLGLVIPDIANPFWAEVARGAQDRAFESDMSLLVFSSDWQAKREEKHIRALRQVRADGAVINPIADSDGVGRFGLPFVLIGSSAERIADVSSVGSDILQAVTLGMDYMVSKGHPAPSLIVGPKSRIARARFLRAVNEHCLARDFDPALLEIDDGEYTVEGGFEAMKRLLGRNRIGHRAIFAANDLMALGALMAVREAGLRCPDDVSILGFDGIPGGAFSNPGLTTIEKPARAIGRRAVECLFEEIDHHRETGRIYLPCALVERGSVADLSRRAEATTIGSGRI
jgi:LacI family transcriptional regulator